MEWSLLLVLGLVGSATFYNSLQVQDIVQEDVALVAT